MGGSVEHLVRRADFDDPAEVHDGDAVGDVAHHRKIVRDEQVGQAELASAALQQVDDLRLDRHVERGDRLVENEQLGTQRQSTGNCDALALAAGEFARPAAGRLQGRGRPAAAARQRAWGPMPCD